MYIELKKVSTHNLKGFDLKIPLNQLVVITGPSGSGKSSLAFDTIAALAEARFRFSKEPANPIISLPRAKGILRGIIPPVIALSQGVRDWFVYKNVSEILGFFSFIAFLFFEKGKVKCPHCGSLNSFHSLQDLISWYKELPRKTRFYFLLPLQEASPKAISYFISQGYTRFIINNQEYDLSEEEIPNSVKSVYLLLDRIIKEEKEFSRLLENARISHSINRGNIVLKILEGDVFSFNLSSFCSRCGIFLSREWVRCRSCKGLGYKEKKPCEVCNGLKLEPSYLESKLFSTTLKEIFNFNLKDFKDFLESNLLQSEKEIFQNILYPLERGEFFEIDHLRLSTPVFELSLGERKLLEILTILSSELQGVLYILDEPTLGLDEEKRKKLLFVIRELIAKGNSFIIVEHDLNFIKEADFVIELGPEGGERGGYLFFALPKDEYLKNKDTLIYPYLNERPSFERRPLTRMEFIEVSNGEKTIKILKEGINLFSGKTGKGITKKLKILAEKLKNKGFDLYDGEEVFMIKGNKFLIEYIGIWEAWREILVNLPEAKAKGLTKRYFSFHTPEGQCPTCKGRGYKKIEMEHFELESLCEICLGKGLNYEVLSLTYKGYKIFELLDFTVDEALPLFERIASIKEILYRLKELNLAYLKLSQKLSELSGGEKLRIALVKRLLIKREKPDFLILYFPFQGLSIRDLENLGSFFRKLNSEGITLLIRETHPFAPFMSDHIIKNYE